MDVLHGELRGDEAAGRPCAEQPFLLEPVEHEPQRRARDLQPRRKRNLAKPLAGPELAAEQELAHLQERAQGL